MKTPKILGLLVSYPNAALVEALPECVSVLKTEGWVSVSCMKAVESFVRSLQAQDLLDAQEEYVGLFDRTPSLSLHLFEHVHGDSRDRGQALVDLGNLYTEKGLKIASDEMPDYLPIFMEYLSILPPDEAKEGLDGISHILAAMTERLKQRESAYAGVMDAVLSILTCKPDAKAVQTTLAKGNGAAPDFEEMDKAWEEQFALKTPDPTAAQDCPKASAMLARMNQIAGRAS
ncbi:MAG: nitrate reductase molybdenum cofactor assembly chaperone [Rhodospirillales bacterium]|nr:nitrate reductase molybdenum cofactor assembly chaperone [Alphaproteobacteria bacterium]MCB9986807.1 nitrate reductase molybdenum cofactor assembly chaperone [Rhodospirillales bacterium]USO08428.1 MAG: nitrate reductase molybdenum cofactor assembly chaperone [Rhodospirillales bacterium]